MLTKKSTATKKKKRHLLGPGAHTRAWGREGELNCKYGLATDISEILLLREERVSDLSLFAILSVSYCLPCLIIEVTLLRNVLNFAQ